eukprot:Rmarinus@m.21219
MASRRDGYESVPLEDLSSIHREEDEVMDARMEERNKTRSIRERRKLKLEALLWMGLMAWVVHTTDFVNTVLYNPQIDWVYLSLALICFAIDIIVYIYLAIYVKHILKSTMDWNDYAPKAIPIATASGLLCGVFWVKAVFPVYRWWSFPILCSVGMGMMMSLHWVPSIPYVTC